MRWLYFCIVLFFVTSIEASSIDEILSDLTHANPNTRKQAALQVTDQLLQTLSEQQKSALSNALISSIRIDETELVNLSPTQLTATVSAQSSAILALGMMGEHGARHTRELMTFLNQLDPLEIINELSDPARESFASMGRPALETILDIVRASDWGLSIDALSYVEHIFQSLPIEEKRQMVEPIIQMASYLTTIQPAGMMGRSHLLTSMESLERTLASVISVVDPHTTNAYAPLQRGLETLAEQVESSLRNLGPLPAQFAARLGDEVLGLLVQLNLGSDLIGRAQRIYHLVRENSFNTTGYVNVLQRIRGNSPVETDFLNLETVTRFLERMRILKPTAVRDISPIRALMSSLSDDQREEFIKWVDRNLTDKEKFNLLAELRFHGDLTNFLSFVSTFGLDCNAFVALINF